jgi:DNA-binding transcriptional LysR family regulator
MELTDLRYFVHVATLKSFGAGAKRAHISPSAITKAVQRLESELGVSVFERTTRRVALTTAGERLLEHGREIISRVDAIPRELGESRGEVSGDLRVAAMEVFSINLLPAALTALVSEHPSVTPLVYEMTPDRMERHLADGTLDVGLTIGGGGARGVIYESLGVSPGVVVCGRAHPLYARGRITRADLTRHSFVVPRFFQREHLPSLDQFPESSYPRRQGATIELMQMGIDLAIGGAYLGYFPRISVAHHVREGALRALEGLRSGPPFQLRMLLRGRGSAPASVVALARELRKVLRRAEGSA